MTAAGGACSSPYDNSAPPSNMEGRTSWNSGFYAPLVVLREALRDQEPEDNVNDRHNHKQDDGPQVGCRPRLAPIDRAVNVPVASAICAPGDIVDVGEDQVDETHDANVDAVQQVVRLAGQVDVQEHDHEVHAVREVAERSRRQGLRRHRQHPVPVEDEDKEGTGYGQILEHPCSPCVARHLRRPGFVARLHQVCLPRSPHRKPNVERLDGQYPLGQEDVIASNRPDLCRVIEAPSVDEGHEHCLEEPEDGVDSLVFQEAIAARAEDLDPLPAIEVIVIQSFLLPFRCKPAAASEAHDTRNLTARLVCQETV
mmetsp:Transcript_79998/g.193935  ORF Transcript_79998/g.193935 Transcript_79998/m.193935 type:complete len:312 (-) Transcript_79998:28-963(-)